MNSGLRSRRHPTQSPQAQIPQAAWRSTSACSGSTDGTSSSLGGTKQWLDDVLTASQRCDQQQRDAASSSEEALQHRHLSEQQQCFAESSLASQKGASCESTATASTASSIQFRVVGGRGHSTSVPGWEETAGSSSDSDANSSSSGSDSTTRGRHSLAANPAAAVCKPYSQRTLSIRELLSLYKLLDGDNDGLVSTFDLFAFLSLHPQSIDLTVETFYHTGGQRRKARRSCNPADVPAGSRGTNMGGVGSEADSSVPVLVPHSGMSVLSSCSRSRIRDPELYQRYCRRRFRRGEVPTTNDLLGPTWWVHHRLRCEEGARRFVSFVLRMTAGLANCAPTAAAGGSPRPHPRRSASSPQPQQQRGTDHHADSVLVPHVTFYSFQQLYYHCAALLRSRDASYMFAALDLPMLSKLMWFYEFVDIVSRSSGRQWDWILHHDPDEHTHTDPTNKNFSSSRLARVADSTCEISVADASWVQQRFHHVEDLFARGMIGNASENHGAQGPASEEAPQPLYTCLPAVYWTFAAWDIPRGWFDVSILQRLGERYMQHSASRHARVMRQFLRQLWVSQHNNKGGSTQQIRMPVPQQYEQATQQQPAVHGRVRQMMLPPAVSVAEKLALVQLSNRFLSFHHIQQQSGRRSSRSSQLSTASGSLLDAHPPSDTLAATTQQLGRASSPRSAHSMMHHGVRGTKSTSAPPQRHRRTPSSTTLLTDKDEFDDEGNASKSFAAAKSSSLSSLVGRVARDGVHALWETVSNASTQASPKKPLLRRATWRHAQHQSLAESTELPPPPPRDGAVPLVAEAPVSDAAVSTVAAAPAVDAPTRGAHDDDDEPLAVEAVVRQSLLSHDLTLHTVLAPDVNLSAIPSLSGADRSWLRRETRKCILRAALYALASAVLISFVDVMAQSWILGEDAALLDTDALSNMQRDVFSFAGFSSAPSSATTDPSPPPVNGNGTSLPASHAAAAGVASLSTIIKYQVAVVIGTLCFSLIEVVFLYLDTLQFCFKMAQTCGIPLEAAQRQQPAHGSKKLVASKWRPAGDWGTFFSGLRSAVSGIIDTMTLGTGAGRSFFSHVEQSSAGGAPSSQYAMNHGGLDDDNRELRVIRQHLVRRRVRFIIAAITRCAMQIRFDPTTVLGIDVRDRNVSRLHLAVSVLGERLKRVAPSVLLRLVAARLLSRMLVPFVAVPVMIMWNIILTQNSIHQARLVSLGTIGVERIVRELLASAFSFSLRASQHNRRLMRPLPPSRLHPSACGPTTVQVPSTRTLFHVPHHCLREMLMIIIFFSHVVQDTKEVHPMVHSLLVELLSGCEMPDVCLWMVPKVSCPSRRNHRKGKGFSKPPNVPSEQKTPVGKKEHADAPLAADDACEQACSGSKDVLEVASTVPCGEPTTGTSDVYATTAVHSNNVLDLALVDVGGSTQCALSATLRTFTRELNRLRAAANEVSTSSSWLDVYVEACPWPMDVGERIELREHIKKASFLEPSRVDDARFTFLIESVFPSWAAPSAMGPSQRHLPDRFQSQATLTPSKTVVEVLEGGEEDLITESDCTVELDQAAADDALRSARCASPFSLNHIKLFLRLGILLVVSTYSPSLWSGFMRSSPGPSSSHKLTRFLLHLRRAYTAAVRNASSQHQPHEGRPGPSSYHNTHPLHRAFLDHTDHANFLRNVDALHASYWAGSPCLTVAAIDRIIDASVC